MKVKLPSAWGRQAMVKGIDFVKMAAFVWNILHIIHASIKQV